MNKENITLILAIWAAFLSTLLAIIEIIKFIKDKPHILVKVENGSVFYNTDEQRLNKSSIIVSVSNRGSRPVTISKIYLLPPSNLNMLATINLITNPVEITEGKSYSIRKELENEASANDFMACAEDVTGRYFWSHNLIFQLTNIKKYSCRGMVLGKYMKICDKLRLFK
ncbi:MAG: hypothetical protein ISS45_02665 [Candidatus Omnitrophica bacterium]|nr:hypothetical protein [Candidatus Omnitrophota bacterium]